MAELPGADLERYQRHLALPEIGARGQQRLRAGRVLIVGVGALGSPAALYLASAGIGTLGLADDDQVRLSNLQRQIIHDTASVGTLKVEAAGERLRRLRPDLRLNLLPLRVDATNALEELEPYDVIVDGTDSFAARYLLSDAAYLLGKPLVHGSIFRVEGQVTVFQPGRGCYRCLYPEPPPPSVVREEAQSGVFAALPGVIGTIQAAEAIKLITGRGEPLIGRVLLHDSLAMTFREVRFRHNPACPLCGDTPAIRALVDYEAFAGAAR
jgi:adenylyltransferase/sulfurtransferase